MTERKNAILKNEFCEVSFSSEKDAVLLKWFPENRRMSEMEFCEQLNTLFSVVKEYKPEVVYIDAFEFNYPILQPMVSKLNCFLDNISPEILGIVNSRHLMGAMGIKSLITKTQTENIRLFVFNSRNDGETWFEEYMKSN